MSSTYLENMQKFQKLAGIKTVLVYENLDYNSLEISTQLCHQKFNSKMNIFCSSTIHEHDKPEHQTNQNVNYENRAKNMGLEYIVL